jgi:hypothetical protein
MSFVFLLINTCIVKKHNLVDASFRAKIAKDYVERHELDSPTDFYYLPKKGDKCDGRLFNCTKMSHEKVCFL